MDKLNIELGDIFEYISTSRPIKEGEAVFKAGHVTLCGLKEDADHADICTIIGSCLQTSNLNGAPHLIEIVVKPGVDVQQWQAKCTCKAGLGGKCKHIVAVLIYANRAEHLEKLSCTDVEQLWGKIGSKASSKDINQYSQAVKMVDFCHPVVKRPKSTAEGNIDEVLQENTEILKNCDIDTALHRFWHGRANLDEVNSLQAISSDSENLKVFEFINSLLNSENEILNSLPEIEQELKTKFYLENISNVDNKTIFLNTIGQNNNFWRNCRKYRLTGSTCYSFFTYSKNKTPDWDTKLHNFFNSTFSGTAATNYGKQEEPNARNLYKIVSNQEVKECGFVVNKKVPWLGFSPDGITDQGFLLEIKCPVAGKLKPAVDILSELNYLYEENEEYFLKKQHTYYGQIQLGMCLLNVEYTDFVIYSSFADKSIHIIKVKKDIEFCKNLINCLQRVYFEKVLPYINKINY